MKVKEVMEFLHLCQLYNSPYTRGFFKYGKDVTLADLERVCQVSKNKLFRDWIKKIGILKISNSEEGYNRYIILESKLKKVIENHSLWKIYKTPSYAIYEGVLRH